MVKFSCYTANKVHWLLAVNPHLTHATEGGETDLRPRKGGAVMMFTFVNTLSMGELCSLGNFIIALIALIRAFKKK